MARQLRARKETQTVTKQSKSKSTLHVAEKQSKSVNKKETIEDGKKIEQKPATKTKSRKRNNAFEEQQAKKVAKLVREENIPEAHQSNDTTPVKTGPRSPKMKSPDLKKLSKKVAQLKDKTAKNSNVRKGKLTSGSEVSSTEEDKLETGASPVKAKVKESVVNTENCSDDSDMEWEDVAEVETSRLYKENEDGSKSEDGAASTSKGVEITIDMPGKKQKQNPREAFQLWLKRKVNRCRREFQINAHKVHLLTLLAIGLRKNTLCNNPIIQAVAVSLLPAQMIQKNLSQTSDIPYLMKLTTWMKNKAPSPGDIHTGNSEATYLMRIVEKKVFFLVILLRALGLHARLVMSLQTLNIKLDDKQIKKSEKVSAKTPSKKQTSLKDEATAKSKTPKNKQASTSKKKAGSVLPSQTKRKNKDRERRTSEYFKGEDDSDDEDFLSSTSSKTPKRPRSSGKTAAKDEVPYNDSNAITSLKKKGVDIWVEVYVEKEKKWISIEGNTYTVNQPEECEKHATAPIKYVIAFDNDNCIKDITARYAGGWLTTTSKLRVESEWWTETLDFFKTKNLKRDKKEDKDIKSSLVRKPLPATVSEFKNHPLYALERHLLKFEAIYPETAATLGFCRGEPVYSRDCVHQLHTREIWMKEARVVKAGEQPYKIVKGRKSRRKMLDNVGEIMADLFGRWQTEDYVPPPVIDGKIPRNEYGNVELFKPSMLPGGTVHLQVPGIHRLARKLDIEAVPAVVGFDFHGGFSHPVIDGVVVCEEHKDTLLKAWNKEQEEKIKREQQKREKRALDNWRHLVRSLKIRERLKRKYNMEAQDDTKANDMKKAKKVKSDDDEDNTIADLSLSWPLNKQEGKTTRADNGHCHVFPEDNHQRDAITGDWSKVCSCGHKEPL